jgi:hypothetical protein
MIGYLLSILTASNRVAQTETNFEKIEREVFTLKPTLIAGVANTVVGPPASGERLLDEVWVDSLRAKWHCTVAGTPFVAVMVLVPNAVPPDSVASAPPFTRYS